MQQDTQALARSEVSKRFAMVPEWLLDVAPPRAVVAYARLAMHGPSPYVRKDAASDAGVSVDTFDRCVKALIDVGAVTVEATHEVDWPGDSPGRAANRYHVHPVPTSTEAAA